MTPFPDSQRDAPVFALRLLSSRFVFVGPGEVLEGLRQFAPAAAFDGDIKASHHIDIGRVDHAWVVNDGRERRTAATITEAGNAALILAAARAAEDIAAAFSLLGVVGTWAGRRFLLLGPSGSGKSILAVSLMLAGGDIEGDDQVLVVGETLIAKPHRFFVRQNDVGRLGGQDRIAGSLLDLGSPQYGLRVGVDPTDFGQSWRISYGRPDLILRLHETAGGRSAITPCSRLSIAQHLTASLRPLGSRKVDSAAVRLMSAVASEASTAVLNHTDAASAVQALRRHLSSIPPRAVDLDASAI